MKKLIKLSLSLLILFSFSTIVKAVDYELLIITPAKFQTVARTFLAMHENAEVVGQAQPMYGAYATVEEIIANYDGLPKTARKSLHLQGIRLFLLPPEKTR